MKHAMLLMEANKLTHTLTSESLLQGLDFLITLFLQLCQFLLFAQLADRRHTLPVFDLSCELS